MDAQQEEYQQARKTFIHVTDFLIKGMGPWEASVAHLEPKQCIFRINRDVRFSKDKAPYKTNMGAYLAKEGRHGGYAGYYLHLEPHDQSFIAGGMYCPAADALKQIRQEIDYNAAELLTVLQAPRFKALFGYLQGESLKRMPQGYEEAHPQAALLKMKSFIAMHPIKDSVVTQKDFLSYVLEVFQAIIPLNKFLNMAISA
ncbi:MAG: DUF2461 domain-containing protein [Roseivirga sp.]